MDLGRSRAILGEDEYWLIDLLLTKTLPMSATVMMAVVLMVLMVLMVIMGPCQIRKTAGCACTGNTGNVFPATTG